MRRQQWLGVATVLVLVAVGMALFLRRTPGPSAADCEAALQRWIELYRERVGSEYATLLEGRRDPIVQACMRHGTPAYVQCVVSAAGLEAAQYCAEAGLRAQPSTEPPTRQACEDQADWRIALHEQVELPSIAAGIAQGRANMIETCEAYWSAPYVECLAGAPGLAFAQACDAVGRARTPTP